MKNIFRILAIMKKYNAFLVFAIVLSFISAAIDLVCPYLLGRFIDELPNATSSFYLLILYGTALIVGKLFENIHGYTVTWYNTKTIERVREIANQWLLTRRKYGKLPFEEGGIVTRLTSDIDAISQLLMSPMNGLIPEVLTGVGAIIWLFTMNWGIAVLVLCSLPAFYYITKWHNVKTKELAMDERRSKTTLTSYIMDFVKNYRLYVCYNGKTKEECLSKKLNKGITDTTLHQSWIMVRYFFVIALLRCVVIVASLFILRASVVAGINTAGSVIMVVTYVQNSFSPILQLSRYINQLARSNVAVQRVFDLEPDESEIVPDFAEDHSASVHHVKVADLAVSYPGSERYTLENINFEIRDSGLVCLYGSSGSGKSSLIHVLSGILPTEKGQILVDGQDYTEKMLELVMKKNIRVVFQDSLMFDRTLKENIEYGADPEKIEDSQLEEVYELLGIKKLLNRPEDKMQNGLKGYTISGGERRRVALARGINQSADIYMFDEPTSELDDESAVKVISLIAQLKQHSIVIISTHDARFKNVADIVLSL